MKRLCLVIALIFATLGVVFAVNSVDRLADARSVFEDIMVAPNGGIPPELLDNARCIVIVPLIRGAGLVFGDRYGLGVATCRSETGWTATSNVRIDSGNFGKQIVRGDTSLILLVMSDSAAYRLIKSPLVLGVEGLVVAGPVGRETYVDVDALRCLEVEVIAYTRSYGLNYEMALEGAILRPMDDMNQSAYGSKVRQEEILTGRFPIPQGADSLVGAINAYSGASAVAY